MLEGMLSHVAVLIPLNDKKIINPNNCVLAFFVPRLFYVVALITNTYLYNFDPTKPRFYIIKLRFTGVYIIFYFLFLLKNIDCGTR